MVRINTGVGSITCGLGAGKVRAFNKLWGHGMPKIFARGHILGSSKQPINTPFPPI